MWSGAIWPGSSHSEVPPHVAECSDWRGLHPLLQSQPLHPSPKAWRLDFPRVGEGLPIRQLRLEASLLTSSQAAFSQASLHGGLSRREASCPCDGTWREMAERTTAPGLVQLQTTCKAQGLEVF